MSYLAPTDSDGGGSWIAANECGVTACLLNNYPANPSHSGPFTSRGRLPISLMSARSVTEIDRMLRSVELENYRPFYLFAMGEVPGSAQLFRWDGRGAIVSDRMPAPPITTSSYQSVPVVESRTAVYRERFGGKDPTIADLLSYHSSHNPERGAYSVCVHRDDAATKSQSHVRVGNSQVTFTYTDGPPCEESPVTQNHLQLNPQR